MNIAHDPRQDTTSLLAPSADGERYALYSPTALPNAGGFLWNRRMMIHVTCRGYATAQFMQPEPTKYAHAPILEAKTFMQPEQPYYAHHPGRFFYLKDEDTGALYSVPYEPVRAMPQAFCFSAGQADVVWCVRHADIEVELRLQLPVDDPVELWQCQVRNLDGRARRLALYAYFPVGYMSWMYQSGEYRADLGGIVCRSVTGYQKVEDYFRHRDFKDCTFLLHEQTPDAWEARQSAFEGEGGLHAPSAVMQPRLGGSEAHYELPTAALQYRMRLVPQQAQTLRFLFGPATDAAEIADLRARYLSAQGFATAAADYRAYLAEAVGCLHIATPDPHLDNLANHWLPRQVFYHGDVNRLSTDPQTRNYLQDHMGMSYLCPHTARAALLHALSQQESSGAMPDGILLVEGAELKYINQVPHTDHCVWLPVFLSAYLDETGDSALLRADVTTADGVSRSVAERIDAAMRWLLGARDARGLSYIAQGDWCDPMNMVGYRGRGVSGWLSVATAHALQLWARICAQHGRAGSAVQWRAGAAELNAAVNRELWDGDWYARGITDDGVRFGIKDDQEGRIYLNPQSWALLAGTADAAQRQRLLQAIDAQLDTPYGPVMLDPPYTAMREDVGRLTQKYPGSAENGAVYNHAAAFYLHALYAIGDADRAWRVLRAMIPGPELADYLQRGQLPVFVPNYYRGAWRSLPRTAGRSSQLFNTGTAAWLYRCLIEGLFGLKGDGDALCVRPQLPSHWPQAQVQRRFRGALFAVRMQRAADCLAPQVRVDGRLLEEPRIVEIEAGRHYVVEVRLPPG
ncbi:GH36-type glycosyl hydrolase domain-containing protein [Xanthomonas albilineans]|uniref:Putative ndvb protein (Glycosyltransferase family 36 ) n=1 Tax=Xanthomonas albilineans (strain GPE PC73 / CFBP 7063) TaxID=380358 RepID=D2U892_XANAP|nr:glycosyl transferase family 36 [Xanthomonas albilineans]QHQ26886.1 putative ndvb protein (glycosyltransferase family 36) [Xanthomonas albilineans]CBA14629.1 putative ndvb protein (glycosyltransferase family 36) [Xanthomonas albilineans GPE PC73]